jgi:hypothetical protein
MWPAVVPLAVARRALVILPERRTMTNVKQPQACRTRRNRASDGHTFDEKEARFCGPPSNTVAVNLT